MFFLIGILFYSFYVGTFNYDLTATPESVQLMPLMPPGDARLALFLMFIGGAGKSGHVPSLHIWLPDAMEGPTPGAFGIDSRCNDGGGRCVFGGKYVPLVREYAPEQLHWIAYIAAFTAFYAAAVACAQSDIKRVLAFSNHFANWFHARCIGRLLARSSPQEQ
ncbi:MAG: proton-conducting transporter membrane subunit [Hoylesella buccalis]